jgi:hypothetical protein
LLFTRADEGHEDIDSSDDVNGWRDENIFYDKTIQRTAITASRRELKKNKNRAELLNALQDGHFAGKRR